jgi:bifunctional non-homologous end joining protein LigD
VYAGKVGTGFDRAMLAMLSKKLHAVASDSMAFDERTIPTAPVFRRGVHWVEPELVAQIGFSEWTRDGQLRHPRFLGLRTDKSARSIVRE